MMQISQSRATNRGPLIAVIKIQLSSDNIDRIFLHQNDDDYRLAEEFQRKHNLSPNLINHIHQRIKQSRISLQQPQKPQYSRLSAQKNPTSEFQPLFPSNHNQINSSIPEKHDSSYQKPQNQSRTSYFSKNWLDTLQHHKTKQRESIAKENQPHNYTQIQKQKEEQSRYSFDENKPSRVKIIRRDESSRASVRKSFSKTQLSQMNKNVTNRLYNQSAIKKNYLKRIKEKAKVDKEDQQVKQMTMKPKINPISKAIAEGRHNNMGMYEYLIAQAKKTSVRVENERMRHEEKQLQECSFKPQLNPISRKLTNNRSQKTLQSSVRCNKNHQNQDETFRPSLNKISKEIVRGKGNFQERMKSYLEQKNIKLNQMNRQKYLKEKMDHSGQELFRPRISSTRQPKGQQIYQYLYEMKKQASTLQKEEPKPKINQYSDQLVKQIHKKRMAWLFSQLDSDQDGVISPKKINIETLNEDILEIIMPVLFEMEEMNIELNLHEFARAIENLHSSLNSHQKNILYNYSHTQAKMTK